MLGRVVTSGQHALGQRHAHCGRNTLPQRAGGHFNAQIRLVFGVSCGFGSPLAEVAQLLHGQVIAREVQQGIEQHGGMAVGKHKAVAVKPAGVARIVLETMTPQGFGHVGHAQRCAGVTGAGFFNGVHGKGADGIGALSAGGHDSFLYFCVIWLTARRLRASSAWRGILPASGAIKAASRLS